MWPQFPSMVDVSFKSTCKRTNRLQYGVYASARSNPHGIVLRKLISI
jgi:hypothetical protein